MIQSSKFQGALLLSWFGLSLATPLLTKREPSCYNITMPVTISAINTNILSGSGLLASVVVANSLPDIVFDIPISGTFTIFARYCEPEVFVASRTNSLQLLVHGATYDRSGDGEPGNGWEGDQYSWIAYASKQGFPTLSIDRLGNGLSDHPDPILVVQAPAEVETVHEIVVAARAGRLPIPQPRPFNKIIYIGHSYGSLVGNSLNSKYPPDVDATVLTGFSSQVLSAIPGVLGRAVPLSASVVSPTRFGNLTAGYLEISSRAAAETLFFYDGYDGSLFAHDFDIRGTITLGEAVTIASAVQTATKYTNPVFIMTGQNDNIFCNPLGISLIGPAECVSVATNYLADTKTLYPNAEDFGWYVVPKAGHCWQLHYSALESFGQPICGCKIKGSEDGQG